MKSYNEMAKNALQRIDEENKIIFKRKKAIKRTLIPTHCLCLAVAVSFGVKGFLENNRGVEIEENYILYEGIVENAIGTVDQDTGNTANGNSARPNNQNGNPQSTFQTHSGSIIWVFDVIYDGKTYIQVDNVTTSDYETDTLLGDAKDLSSYCKVTNLNGKVYSVKDNSDLLIVELEDGKRFLLKEVR